MEAALGVETAVSEKLASHRRIVDIAELALSMKGPVAYVANPARMPIEDVGHYTLNPAFDKMHGCSGRGAGGLASDKPRPAMIRPERIRTNSQPSVMAVPTRPDVVRAAPGERLRRWSTPGIRWPKRSRP